LAVAAPVVGLVLPGGEPPQATAINNAATVTPSCTILRGDLMAFLLDGPSTNPLAAKMATIGIELG
jgi:hypothetical protein